MEVIITLFALMTSMASAATFVVMVIMEARRKDTAVAVLFLFTLSLFVCVWFAAGYLLILAGHPLDAALYFRPMLSVLMAVFTGTAVTLTRSRNLAGALREAREALALAQTQLDQTKEWTQKGSLNLSSRP